MAFGLLEIASTIIKFDQVGPDICHFINESLAIGFFLNLVLPVEMMTLASTENNTSV